jgi:hypothetical protein
LAEQPSCKRQVSGSNPLTGSQASITDPDHLPRVDGCYSLSNCLPVSGIAIRLRREAAEFPGRKVADGSDGALSVFGVMVPRLRIPIKPHQ